MMANIPLWSTGAVLQTSTMELIREAIRYTLTPEILLLVLVCTALGIILGATPGIGPTLTLALAFPFTFGIDPALGLLIMAVFYGATIYGGSISAILVNVPGTPGSAATLLDGYPMAQQGEGTRALGIATVASFTGGLIGLAVLVLFGPQFAKLALALGSPEVFMMAVLGLTVVAVVSRGPLMKSLASVSIGVFLASIGQDPISATYRYTADTLYLKGGIPVIVVVVGLFAIGQVIELAYGTVSPEKVKDFGGGTLRGVKDALKRKWIVLRSALIGISIGSIPGVGATSSNFFAYLITLKRSKDEEEFGQGKPEGVVAAEAANNASAMGSLIPTLAFGIPGSAATAIFLGYMISAGISPGYQVFTSSLPYVVFLGILLGNIAFVILGLALAKYFARVSVMPTSILIIAITVVSLVGTFSVRNNMLDIGVAILIGILAFALRRNGFSLVALILAYILVPIAERNFRRSLLISGGDYGIFFSRSISLALLVVAIVLLFSPALKSGYERVKSRTI